MSNYVLNVLEGLRYTEHNPMDTIVNLLHEIERTREQVRSLQTMINEMDEIASQNNINIRCRGCGNNYPLDVELSQVNPDMAYCGKDHRCCP